MVLNVQQRTTMSLIQETQCRQEAGETSGETETNGKNCTFIIVTSIAMVP